jgi:hypothetical protein
MSEPRIPAMMDASSGVTLGWSATLAAAAAMLS